MHITQQGHCCRFELCPFGKTLCGYSTKRSPGLMVRLFFKEFKKLLAGQTAPQLTSITEGNGGRRGERERGSGPSPFLPSTSSTKSPVKNAQASVD